MGRYFFHSRDAEGLFTDEEGLDFPHLGAVETEALRALGDFAKDHIPMGAEHLTIEVTDAENNEVMKVGLVVRITRLTS